MRGAVHPISCACESAAAGEEDVMEEGTSKAIPLRRSRGGVRASTARPLRLTERLTAGVRRALSPPRQVWLASLGSAALTVREARAAWSHLVAEGAAVEGWLRRTLGGVADPEADG
jgi:hypothetical protein